MDLMTDSNLLIYTLPTITPTGLVYSPHYSVADTALQKLQTRGDTIWVSTQNLIECYTVMTRPPARGGLGYTTTDALREIIRIKTSFEVLEDAPNIYQEWEALIRTTGIVGLRCYDVRLAAYMRCYGLTHILTFNTRDFIGIPSIVAVDPATV